MNLFQLLFGFSGRINRAKYWFATVFYMAILAVVALGHRSSVADLKAFQSGRDFSAWIGLVPMQNSSGGKDRLGSISKRGDSGR